jgi:hypothetical protein
VVRTQLSISNLDRTSHLYRRVLNERQINVSTLNYHFGMVS